MTDYAEILASDGGVAERGQQIADLFNITPNFNLYTEFRLKHVSQASQLHQHVFNMGKAQVDGTALAQDIAATDANAAGTQTAQLHTRLAELHQTQRLNKAALEKAAGDIAGLQEVFGVLLAGEKNMKGWSNLNIFNLQEAAGKLDTNAEHVREMTDALPLRDGMLSDAEKSLGQLENRIAQREQRMDLLTYLNTGIATAAAVHAPKTARFTRKAKAVQP